jgi:hypothetical protein
MGEALPAARDACDWIGAGRARCRGWWRRFPQPAASDAGMLEQVDVRRLFQIFATDVVSIGVHEYRTSQRRCEPISRAAWQYRRACLQSLNAAPVQ